MSNPSRPNMHAAADEDAIAMLVADHKKVKLLFKQFEKLKKDEGSDEEKAELVIQVCKELKVHAQLEEELFYPAVRKATHEDDLMDEATVEHAAAKELIEQLESMDPGDDLYDAKVTVLGEQIEHHVKEEEGDMFPKAKKAKIDMAALGARMMDRQEDLKSEIGLSDDGEEGIEPPKSQKKSSRGASRSAANGK